MSEMNDYSPGSPCWADLGSPDPDASREFYGTLFGWDAQVMEDPAAGGYTMFKLNGKHVAGLSPLQGPDQPPAWTMFVCTADTDQTLEKVRQAGGNVLAGPMDVFDAGRMAVLVDPTGAVFSVWQPDQHRGAELAFEPGTLTWNELSTRDAQKAKEFYTQVFGWGARTSPVGEMSYTEWLLGDQTVGGMMEMGPNMPAQVPPHWLIYFGVDDCDAGAAKAAASGATVRVPPTDFPGGRFAVLSDPQGALFGILRLAAH